MPQTTKNQAAYHVVIVTNIPAPYRLFIYEYLSKNLGYDNFKVIFCSEKEANRDWEINHTHFAFSFLKTRYLTWKKRYIHYNLDVISELQHFNPDIIITTGFNPTHLFAFLYALLKGKTHIPMTDGTLDSEVKLSSVHRFVRRFIYKHSRAFIGASLGALRLYESYGIKPSQFYQSHLCADNAAFAPFSSGNRSYDLMFSGRFSAEKNPKFALDVAAGVAKALDRPAAILMLGAGPLLKETIAYANTLGPDVIATFPGFMQQAELPALYGSAKVFLFPSSWDPWGVVANEACAAGQAVIVSPHAGVANELVCHQQNGYVLPLELVNWIQHTTELLSNTALLARFSNESLLKVQAYSYQNAAQGILAAINSTNNNSVRLPSEVVIVQRRLTDYRVPLFDNLRTELLKEGITLRLLYSEAHHSERSKHDTGFLPWTEKIPVRYFLGTRVCWQPFTAYVKTADLVIVTQENKLINNLWPLFIRRPYRLAFWGHGKNMQATRRNCLLEFFKKLSTLRVDWWFAYTDLSKKLVEEQGYPAERITNLKNSVDTSQLQALCDSISLAEITDLKASLGLIDSQIGLYIGSLYSDKRLDFLLAAGSEITLRLPNFHLIIIGDGPLHDMIEKAAGDYAWLHYVGRKSGREKALFLKSAHVILNPGLVGLSILDAFVADIPLITTDCGLHSPEIAYLQHGENGFMTANSVEAFSAKVEKVLTNPGLIQHLHAGCLHAAQHLSLENMTANFKQGILNALGVGK